MRKYIYSVFVFFLTSVVLAQEKEMRLSMQGAIEYAIKNNYDNKIASKNIEAAHERKWETTTMGLPQINGKVDYQNWLKQQVSIFPAGFADGFSQIRQLGDFYDLSSLGVIKDIPDAPTGGLAVPFGTKQSVNASVTLTQLLFDGSYLVGLQSAKTYLKISEQAKEKTELSTREAVVNAYGNVLVTEKSIEILESNKRVLEKNLNETQKIYDNGLTELENVEQLQITLGNIENNLNNAKRMKEIAYQMLNISLGNAIETKLVLTDSLDNLVVSNTDLSLLTKVFDVSKHIDYRMIENDRESKRLLIRLEQSKALPSLSAFINYGANANSDTFTFFDSSQQWFDYSLFGVSLNVPIFSSFGRRAKTARARIELENADIKKEEVKQKLSLQAKTAKSEYQLSIENYETAKKNLALAERIEKKQQVKFFEGISSSFDLLQAQNQLYTQQNTYMQSMLNVIAKKAKLENALNISIK
ncbi:Outer membrane efflux protein precursor [Tenacibaculum sp. 190524A02b]|uniref:TolC family protein n=1 Tax=Tenacibaculum vairaonense TaxID=3137860 RepID=UPI0032B30B54